ncbi:MAG: F0F1 ATP synthase subunit gamma, partial [Candidatus Babeliales bacterium]
MSQLVDLKQRLSAIETIQKVTHAMRLISMSVHTHLTRYEKFHAHYANELLALFQRVQELSPQWTPPVFSSSQYTTPYTLFIIIGSQKGLCRTFNTLLLDLFEKEYKHFDSTQRYSLIVIGAKALSSLPKKYVSRVVETYPYLSKQTVGSIAQSLTQCILKDAPYTTIRIYGNRSKSFFNQLPYAEDLFPTTTPVQLNELSPSPLYDYIWETTPEETLPSLFNHALEARIHHLLFLSLLAEQA